MFPLPIEKTSKPVQISYRVGVWIALAVWLLPLFAMLSAASRSLADINAGNLWGMPTQFMLFENFRDVMVDPATQQWTSMARFLLNSVMITVPSVAGALAISTLAAFALARYDFRGNTLLFAAFIAGNFIPFQILMIPVRDLTQSLGLYDTITGLVLFHLSFQAGFCTLFLRNFIKALPNSLVEAARVDGAGEFRIFFQLVLPLIRPALAALAVLTFTFVWNDYFWALVLVQSDYAQPITSGLQSLKGQWTASWQLMSAGAIIAALPPVAMFFAMQRHFIAGLTMGATKG